MIAARAFGAALVVLAACAARAQEPAAAPAPAFVFGPYAQDVGPHTATLVYGTAPSAPPLALELKPPAPGTLEIAPAARGEVRLDQLTANTEYKYFLRVGASLVGGRFHTPPEPDASASDVPVDFLVFGDTRDSDVPHVLAARMAAEPAQFALDTGDFVRSAEDETAWSALQHAIEPVLRAMPLYVSIGNHDIINDPSAEHLSRYFLASREPDGTPAGLDRSFLSRRYYTFRWGAVRIIALDGGIPEDAAQLKWLEKTLARSKDEPGLRHVFALMHQPALSDGYHCGAGIRQRAWVDLFERYGVRAVFAGHDHAYERLERNGLRHFISGGGGAPLYPEQTNCPQHDRDALKVYVSEHHYLRVHVAGDNVEVTAVRPSGEIIETVRWSAADAMVKNAIPLGAPPPKHMSGRPPVWPWVAAVAVGLLLLFIGVSWWRRRG